MKKRKALLAIAAIGTGDWIAVHKATEKKQEKARKRGGHIPYGAYEAVIKRPLDAALSGLALVILSPMLAIIGLLVRVKLGSPVLFTQERPGLDEKIFKIYKFRTMTDAKGADGRLLPDEERLTGFGKLLRSASLDELPELFNILKGDMAIVGPRPLLVRYLPYFNEAERCRHDVRPGLTGLAQIHGRNAINWDRKFEWDLKYVEKITFIGDVKAVFHTAGAVLFHRDDVKINAIEDFDVYRKRQNAISKSGVSDSESE